MAKEKREGGVGDTWNGLLGYDYKDQLMELISRNIEVGEIMKGYGNTFIKKNDENVIDIHSLHTINEEEKSIQFKSIFPYFEDEADCVEFEVFVIDEWKNEIEAVFEGNLFGQRLHGFYCQNYLQYKDADLVGKTITIRPSLISYAAEIVQEEKRSFIVDEGPTAGETHFIDKIKFVNPSNDDDLEISTFMFPIEGIEKISFLDTDVLKIQGSIPDKDDNDTKFFVYVNPSNINNPELVRIGEPFQGMAWVQAEIVDVK